MIERKNYGITPLCESGKEKNISGAADLGAAARRGHGFHTRPINCQKLNFLLFLTINSVTTAVRELNGTSQISLVTHDAKGEMREI